MNGIYDAISVIIIFPIIVSMGAGGILHSARSARICKFLGDISYPLYITHYSIIYIYTAWVVDNKKPIGVESMLAGLLVVVVSIALAYACLKLYDEPVREWLKRKVLMKKV